MATSTIRKPMVVEDITDKLNFTALRKKAVKIGNVVHFWAEFLFNTHIADYTYSISVDSSILPTETDSVYGLSAIMTDIDFSPKGDVTCWITDKGMYWRASSSSGNYLIISGSWVI